VLSIEPCLCHKLFTCYRIVHEVYRIKYDKHEIFFKLHKNNLHLEQTNKCISIVIGFSEVHFFVWLILGRRMLASGVVSSCIQAGLATPCPQAIKLRICFCFFQSPGAVVLRKQQNKHVLYGTQFTSFCSLHSKVHSLWHLR